MAQEWRVAKKLPLLKAAGAIVFVVTALVISGDSIRFVVAGAAAALLGFSALRDVLIPVRLRADATGLWITAGLSGEKFVDWRLVEALKLDKHRRFGLRHELLEIDTGTDLYLFSENEVGTKPEEALAALCELRAQYQAHSKP